MRRIRSALLGAWVLVLTPGSFSAAGELQAASATGIAVARIVNGIATQGEPTTGALLFGPARRALCSGTLIGCQTFLTAAHCVCANGDASMCGTLDPASFRVYLQHGGIVDVAAVAVHPAYEFGVASDIAALALAVPVWGITPTPINTATTPEVGTTATIAGFGISGGRTDDGGLKRDGAVTTATCAAAAPEPAHVCWSFAAPVGPPGTDSNTCSGDSGGPLFVDVGAGEVVAGVTSGGSAIDCLPPDLSYDTNVFENRDFIQSVGGTDLSSVTCGSISHVGEPDTVVVALEAANLTRTETICRTYLRKRYSSYVIRALTHLGKCLDRVNRGAVAGPCPDASTALALARALGRVDPLRIDKKCPAEIVPSIRAGAGCAGARDAADLAACIVAAADAAVGALLDVEYAQAEPFGALPTEEAQRCQAGIAATLSGYATTRSKVLTDCQAKQDDGKVASCPDAAAALKLATLIDAVEPGIERRCSDAQVTGLGQGDPFGGTCAAVATTADLAACATAEHDATVTALLGVLANAQAIDRTSATVASETERLRVTLNGVDAGVNDLDLYVKLGAPPSTTDFDVRSAAVGVFEAIEVTEPAAGTWHVLVHTYAGSNVPFQLTITTFQP